MIKILAVVKKACPDAKDMYLEAFDKGDQDFLDADINDALTVAHFLAQTCHETDGFTILTENMNYSAPRMMKVWPRRFPTIASAKPYEHNPEKLAEKTYGGRMGNGPEGSGDGWKYIGRGVMQVTGKESYKKYGDILGIDLVGNPSLAIDSRYCLKIALHEWAAGHCSEKARRGAIKEITETINGGLIGYNSRVDWFNKLWPVVQEMFGQDPIASWKATNPDPDVKWLQESLVSLGYSLDVDGRKGPETVTAIRKFQKDHKLHVDGVAGKETRTALDMALNPPDTKEPREPVPVAPSDTTAPGLGLATVAQTGDAMLSKTSSLLPSLGDLSPVLHYLLVGATAVGAAMVLYGIIGPWLHSLRNRGAPA